MNRISLIVLGFATSVGPSIILANDVENVQNWLDEANLMLKASEGKYGYGIAPTILKTAMEREGVTWAQRYSGSWGNNGIFVNWSFCVKPFYGYHIEQLRKSLYTVQRQGHLTEAQREYLDKGMSGFRKAAKLIEEATQRRVYCLAREAYYLDLDHFGDNEARHFYDRLGELDTQIKENICRVLGKKFCFSAIEAGAKPPPAPEDEPSDIDPQVRFVGVNGSAIKGSLPYYSPIYVQVEYESPQENETPDVMVDIEGGRTFMLQMRRVAGKLYRSSSFLFLTPLDGVVED